MSHKCDEPFQPKTNATKKLEGLIYKMATQEHVEGIFELMRSRNPSMPKDELYKRTEREVIQLNDGVKYGVFVAEYKGRIVGFCRFYDGECVPKEKIKFAALPGIYLMGIMVAKDFRRRGVATFLSLQRFEWLRSRKIKQVYSGVEATNLASLEMHESLGFVEIERVAGILTLRFESGEGILFRKTLI